MKKVIVAVISIVLIAGIGIGIYFGVRSKNKSQKADMSDTTTADVFVTTKEELANEETTKETSEKTTEDGTAKEERSKAVNNKQINSTVRTNATTKHSTVETVKYGESSITKSEFDKYAPIESKSTNSFEKGKFYAPTRYYAGYGYSNISWGDDGRTVVVGFCPLSAGHIVYKLNEYGEIVEETKYYARNEDVDKVVYIKEVVKPTEVYNDKHWLVETTEYDCKHQYEHDEKGNITKIIYSQSMGGTDAFTYDEHGNIIKFVIKDYYKVLGSGGYWKDYDSHDRIVTIRPELNSVGLPMKQWEKYNGDEIEREYNFSYVEVSEAQYNFYVQSLKSQKYALAHSIV